MSLDFTPSPQNEFEARITALLLGELSAKEEAVVREAIAKDLALAQLHARLQKTIGLVGEAARSASEQTTSDAPTLRLSEERREKLLRSFKVIKPHPSFWSRWQNVSMRDVSSVAAMFVVLGLLAWVLFAPRLASFKMMESVGEPDAKPTAEFAYDRKQTPFAAWEEQASSAQLPVLGLPHGGAKHTAESPVIAGENFFRDSRIIVNGQVASPAPPPTEGVVNNFTTPASDAPQALAFSVMTVSTNAMVSGSVEATSSRSIDLAGPVAGKGAFGGRLDRLAGKPASSPSVNPPALPAEVAQRSSRIALPVLAESAPALDDLPVVGRLFRSESQTTTTLGSEVSDPQAARGFAVNTPAPARPGMVSGSPGFSFTIPNPQPQPEFGWAMKPSFGGVASTSGGMAGGGGAGGREWFGQAAAQPNNFAWSAPRPIDQSGPVATVADGVVVDYSITPTQPAAPATAGTPQNSFFSNGRFARADDAAKAKSDRSGVGNSDAYVGVQLAPATGALAVDGGAVARPALPPVATPAPVAAPQPAGFGGVAGQSVMLGDKIQLYDSDSPAIAPENRFLGRNPQDQEIEKLNRSSGARNLDGSTFEKKKQLAQIEDQVTQLPSLQKSVGDAQKRELDRKSAIDALEERAGEKMLKEINGDVTTLDDYVVIQNGGEGLVTLRPVELTGVTQLEQKRGLSELAAVNGSRMAKGIALGLDAPVAAVMHTNTVFTTKAVGYANITTKTAGEMNAGQLAFRAGKDFGTTPADGERSEAKPALKASESRTYRSRILLPEQSEGLELAKREPQIQTGPVSSSEVELRFKKASGEELAKLAKVPSNVEFKEGDLSQTLDAYQDISGRSVLRPRTLPAGKVRIESATPLTRDETKQALNTALSLNEMTLVEQGDKFVKAVPEAQSPKEANRTTDAPWGLTTGGGPETAIYKLTKASAAELSAALQPLATRSGKIVADAAAGVVVVRDTPESLKKMTEAVRRIESVSKDDSDNLTAPKLAVSAPIPQPEVATAENTFSTFSLNVSDVSFKLAGAALEKGQMPDPSTVRSEEFINAFDYRDPEPMGSTPIAFAWERARYPFAHDRDLVRLSVKTAASGRQPGRPLNLVLLLDNSGSMERADRLRIRQECLRVLASQLQPQDRVSVVAFARTARLWVDGLPGNQAGELPQRVGGLTPEGGTNLEDAMNVAYQTAQRHFLAGGVNRVVLLTDGAANLGDVEPESLKKKVEAQRKQGIALDCFGIGWDGLNDELLEALSRNGDGRYGFVNTPEAAQDEFAGQLAGALKVAASDVKVQVEWNPRRVTAYRQIGYAKHQLKKEQFRDNTVDAAEIGAAEAGNALYTVQVNPRGEGPLGTVRVRFKVPGTSDYREHEWPLTYEGGARPLDQSNASLRLAATASAFSEWLVSSPYAAEVTPDKLISLLGDAPETCGADPRPKKLEWMIRQAKSVAGK